jgi:UDP-N-acetylglucosamine--N-acetylmuramyl-(pentapeptide) pyrophosphoryl-undecaprenol N-acetylglucosamine transferase
MKILAVGGGSGGHVTPVVAVLRELKARHPKAELRFWCDKKFSTQARSIVHHYDPSLRVDTILAGKLRRYNNMTIWQQMAHPRTILLPNLRDMLFVAGGFVQSLVKLSAWRPDVVFTKGGFVCLPVGLAAKILGIPLVIHDSDAHPGLTNRILARWASAIATGAPLENYTYNPSISRYVGIPISSDFKRLNDSDRQAAKISLGVDPKRPLVVVTGGGLGAKRINDAVALILSDLLDHASVILISGAGQYDELRALTPVADDRFQLHAFVSKGMARMLSAADIVVARAGATTILELAAAATPTILIPNGYLTGGHQLKNAQAYARDGAVSVLDEHAIDADSKVLLSEITTLLADANRRQVMADMFHHFARPNAANDMADMILSAAKKR